MVVRKSRRHPNLDLTEPEIRVWLATIERVRDDALIRTGLSAGLRINKVITISTSEVDFERGLIKFWDDKKDQWRPVMPTPKTLGVLWRYLNKLDWRTQYLFPLTTRLWNA